MLTFIYTPHLPAAIHNLFKATASGVMLKLLHVASLVALLRSAQYASLLSMHSFVLEYIRTRQTDSVGLAKVEAAEAVVLSNVVLFLLAHRR
jgi:hypothetical protein